MKSQSNLLSTLHHLAGRKRVPRAQAFVIESVGFRIISSDAQVNLRKSGRLIRIEREANAGKVFFGAGFNHRLSVRARVTCGRPARALTLTPLRKMSNTASAIGASL